MYRQSHHVVIAAFESGHADVAYPFLYAVCSGFVEGAVRLHVVIDFIVTEGGESDFGGDGEGDLFLQRGERDTGDDGVGFSRQGLQHGFGIGYIARLAVYFPIEPDDGVGSNKERIIFHEAAIGGCFFLRDVEGNLFARKGVGVGFVHFGKGCYPIVDV